MQSLLIPPDTTLEAARVQLDALRSMGPERRLAMGMRMCNTMRSMLAAGVRHRHPDYNDAQVRLAVLRLMVGPDLFQECCPGVTIEP